MNPGDLIEWVYENSHKVVGENEELWSTPMKCYAPIGSSLVHIIISIDKEHIVWMNEEGLFHMRVYDVLTNERLAYANVVVPYTREMMVDATSSGG